MNDTVKHFQRTGYIEQTLYNASEKELKLYIE